MSSNNLKAIISIVLLLIALPILFLVGQNVVTLLTKAAPILANIEVDVLRSQAALERPWEGLSQGGETESNGALVSLAPVQKQIKSLAPRYIRLDHVLERPYEARVKEVISAGAIPFISLSYFPPDVADRDIGTVHNWAAWQKHVRNLVENVSGRNKMNVSGVYYEIWNEPDGEGFGGYSIGEDKDYFILYEKTLEAIRSAKNVNDFKVGGPALADLRRCTNIRLLFTCDEFWLDRFLGLVAKSNSRLDFISWHRYSTKMSDYNEDVNFINDLYNKHSSLPPAEKIISEWGSVPQRSPIHNTVFDAAHLVAAARTFIGHADMSTKFEIRDGPTSENQGWGILTYGGAPKPTYAALKLLNKLRTDRVLLSGEGNYVTGIASRDSAGTTVVLVNYDAASSYTEIVPVKIINLTPGTYRLTKTQISSIHPLGRDEVSEVSLEDGQFFTQTTMLPNSIVSFDLQLVGFLEGSR